jgi:hypothetical protein
VLSHVQPPGVPAAPPESFQNVQSVARRLPKMEEATTNSRLRPRRVVICISEYRSKDKFSKNWQISATI